jgi:hypothetical protein
MISAGNKPNGPRAPWSIEYREKIADLLKQGKWREAMTEEIKDIRRVARDTAKEPRKYNEASLEMLEYFKCLEKNGLLPNAKGKKRG